MALSTYAELQASVKAWFYNRADLVAVIPDFIRLAEAQMDGVVRHRLMATTVAFEFDGELTDLPADFRGLITLADASQIMTSVTLEQMATDKLYVTDATDKRYAILGSQLQVWPAPANGDTATLVYMAAIPTLAADGDTNWVLTRYPNAYLYGALMQAAPYLAKDDRVAVWAAGYGAALQAIRDSDAQERHRGASVRASMSTP